MTEPRAQGLINRYKAITYPVQLPFNCPGQEIISNLTALHLDFMWIKR